MRARLVADLRPATLLYGPPSPDSLAVPLPQTGASPGAIPPVAISPAATSAGAADDPLRGIALVVVAMASFSVSDAAAKYLSASLPAIEIAWLRWVGFFAIMLPFIVRSRGAALRSRAPLLQVARTFGLLGSACFFILSLHYLPLATAAAIAFAAPLLVTALSIPLLGESVGPRRWAAVVAGLIGVLVVIRPGTGTFGVAAVYPLLSAVSWAFGMIATRKISQLDDARTTMSYSALVGLAALSLLVPFEWVAPEPPQLALAMLMAIASTAAQFLVVTAYRLARASVLAPISYSQLIWSGLLGLFVFGNVPDVWTLVGTAIIIGSGVYTAHRERVTARARAAARPAEA